jgi:transcription elongation GreA/GreB family factor
VFSDLVPAAVAALPAELRTRLMVTQQCRAEDLDRARAAYAAAQAGDQISSDRTAMARTTRDLRYWSARRASAQLVEPRTSADSISFGHSVSFERADGRIQTYAIVGDDEADPHQGSVSYVSPLARAVMGKTVGDVVTLAGQEVEIIAVT